MTTFQTPRSGNPSGSAQPGSPERRHDPRLHGVRRIPCRRLRVFDLNAFGEAVERRDLDYQLGHYAPDADIRIVDPDHPPSAPRIVRGTSAIRSWLFESDVGGVEVEVTHLVDGHDRFAFTQGRRYADGTSAVIVSTAELQDGLITTQHTILAWATTWC